MAGFVGRDRGYRALGFNGAGTMSTHDEPSVTLGQAVPDGGLDGDGWILVVDEDQAPQGWLNPGRDTPRGDTISDELLYRGGTLAIQGGTLREALDACLSSPSGRGVIVDEHGRLLGSVTAREVLELIEAQGSPALHGEQAGRAGQGVEG